MVNMYHKHPWEPSPGAHLIETCSLCGLVRAEPAWAPGSGESMPTVEFSTHQGEVIARGKPNKTRVPICKPGKYFD